MTILEISKAFMMKKAAMSLTYFTVSWTAFSNLMSPVVLVYTAVIISSLMLAGKDGVNCSKHLEGTRIG